MRRGPSVVTAVGALLVIVALTLPASATTATGYALSYTRAPGSVPNPNVDLTRLSTSDSGGPNVSVIFSVAGTVELGHWWYGYSVWFGGIPTQNATALVTFSNNRSDGYLTLYPETQGRPGLVPIAFVSGPTLGFSIAKSDVGPATRFMVEAEASEVNGSASWLGPVAIGPCGEPACYGWNTTASPPPPAGSVPWNLVGIVLSSIGLIAVVAVAATLATSGRILRPTRSRVVGPRDPGLGPPNR